MTAQEWIYAATVCVLDHQHQLPLDQAHAIAEDLYQVWPGLSPKQAVEYFYAPITCAGDTSTMELT